MSLYNVYSENIRFEPNNLVLNILLKYIVWCQVKMKL